MSINFKSNPFFLSDKDIEWVNSTIENMTVEEKIGQLFFPIGARGDDEFLHVMANKLQIGGIMYRPGVAAEVLEVHRKLQEYSKIPMLLAANLEAGGSGAAIDGTTYGKPMQCGATNDEESGYWLGKVSCGEGAALGLNLAFAPIVDIDMNWRNPITNLRTFGNNADLVIRMASGYLRAADEENVAVSIKHFPGDGVDERDQHLVTSVNSLSCEEWDNTVGKVYKTLINQGAKTVMIGHIAQPAYQEHFEPGSATNRLIPASLSKALMVDLLREKLGFNGLILTDATPMLGFTTGAPRKLAVPTSIANGADMFLFNKDIQEDFVYMLDGYKNGIITEERLNDAVLHILATKASLKLHEKQADGTLVPQPEALSRLNCAEFVEQQKICADKSVTLIKDTQKLLPISAANGKRMYLNVLEPNGKLDTPLKNEMKARFEAEGFTVTVRDRDTNIDIYGALLGTNKDPRAQEMLQEMFCTVEDFKKKFDIAVYVCNMETASNNVVIRLQWQGMMGMGNDAPWFTQEIPTLFVSLANPYHLIDVPMIPTFINAYTNTNAVIDAVMEKIMGRSEFKGVSPVDASCGRKDTMY